LLALCLDIKEIKIFNMKNWTNFEMYNTIGIIATATGFSGIIIFAMLALTENLSVMYMAPFSIIAIVGIILLNIMAKTSAKWDRQKPFKDLIA
jgi:hypothetical protein